MKSKFKVLRVVLGLIAFGSCWITTANANCHEEQDWCATVSGVCNSEETKSLCPLTCGSCLPEICRSCEQNCTTFDDGKEYQCTCNQGYKLSSDDRTCLDIDECDENPDICGADLVCKNNRGHYECLQDECRRFHREDYIRSYSYPDKCCKMTKGICGQNNQNASPGALRIFRGESAAAGMWPWHAIIRKGDLMCGGTLISKNWIVTGAQCFRSVRSGRINGFQVVFGSVERVVSESHTSQERRITHVTKYPRFRFPRHDIALAKLNRPIQESQYVKPICLPNGEIPKDGTRCFASGFGVTGTGSFQPADVLQHVDLKIVNINTCAAAYKASSNKVDKTTMICAGGGSTGKDTCMGDSGGPLVCQRCDSCDWFLVGITSFGSECGSSQRPGVYTNVAYYERWIARTIREVQIKKKQCKPVSWSDWGKWTSCSRSCGTGVRNRIRICSVGTARGLPGCLGNWFDRQSCNTLSCGAGSWSKWTSCSKSCGVGEQTRSTKCETDNCESLTEARECNRKECPQWSRWSQWSRCSLSCGGGARSRRRSCKGGSDNDCGGQNMVSESCNDVSCPKWGSWSEWGPCSEECGGGIEKSTRICNGGTAGVDCKGRIERTQECNRRSCRFTKWGSWTRCSKSCGEGVQERRRDCPKISCRSDEFGITLKDTQTCNIINCVGKWSVWGLWAECSRSCGDGVQRRIRTCQNGLSCAGDSIEEVACNSRSCFGTWTSWSIWSSCDVTCGVGKAERSRICRNGGNCLGDSKESKTCSNRDCPTWSEWASWSTCDRTCGKANMIRQRFCKPARSDCVGEPTETMECSQRACPEWDKWSGWSSCSTTCGNGERSRERECQNGPGCIGDSTQKGLCYAKPCPRWTDWSDWSTCDAACGDGNRKRNRSCQHGDDCQGNADQSETCKLRLCPTWSDWSDWTACSKTCGGGEQSRSRNCDNAVSDTDKCQGDAAEAQNCATETCPVLCDDLCDARVKLAYCRLHSDWMAQLCASDCCGPNHCRDETPECRNGAALGGCGDQTFAHRCLVSCGYCSTPGDSFGK